MKSNNSLFLLFLLLFASPVLAQLEITSERDDQGNVNFFANNLDVVPYTVILNFSQLQNMTTSGGGNVVAVASPGKSKVATLKPTLAGQGTNYRYGYTYLKGNVYGKSKNEPVYLIPVEEGIQVKAGQLRSLLASATGEESKGELGVFFEFDGKVKLVAPRKGVVSAIKSDFVSDKEGLTYSREQNFIELYHEDGTLTKILVVDGSDIQVKVGDVVIPGQVLGSSSGENYSGGPHVQVDVLKVVKNGADKLKYERIQPLFHTQGGAVKVEPKKVYEVIHSEEVITAELSKKELKSYQSEKE